LMQGTNLCGTRCAWNCSDPSLTRTLLPPAAQHVQHDSQKLIGLFTLPTKQCCLNCCSSAKSGARQPAAWPSTQQQQQAICGD
jgi:hypothetical protein